MSNGIMKWDVEGDWNHPHGAHHEDGYILCGDDPRTPREPGTYYYCEMDYGHTGPHGAGMGWLPETLYWDRLEEEDYA